MPIVKVPLFSPVYQNVNGEELSDENYRLVDGYLNELGYTVKRPGLSQVLDLGYGTNFPIEGLFWWPLKQVVIAVANNKVHKIENISGTLTATDITSNGPGTAGRPVFAQGVNSNVSTPTIYGILAAGGAMVEGHGTGLTISNFATISDGDAPTAVSHIDFIDGYLVATTGKTFWQWSDVNAPLSWTAASFASAMRNPDAIVALKVFRRIVVLLGQESTELWENNGTAPFAPTEGGFFDVGCIAPSSLVHTQHGLFWLSDERHFVKFDGSKVEEVSTPFDDVIHRFSAVADCFGMHVEIRGRPFIIWQFPTEERTLVLNATKGDWSEWANWDSSAGEYRQFLGKSHAYTPDWGMHLIGSRKDSKIYLFSPDYEDDAGEEIRFCRVSGHIDFGTLRKKRSKGMELRIKRGQGLPSGTEPVMTVRWNDDNRGWSNERTVSLGKLGDTEIVQQIDTRGIFKTRQYEFTVTDSVQLSFGSAEEEIEVLAR